MFTLVRHAEAGGIPQESHRFHSLGRDGRRLRNQRLE